ncbi:hypothetical protein BH10PSE9_BH10PSE9_19850 [soil metagenome]
MRRLAIIGSFVLALAAAVPVRADEVLDGIAKMPGAVEDVRIGGTWESSGNTGAYRLVIARVGGDTITARFFVQWIAYLEGGGAKVENTIEIKELADLKVDVIDFNSESDQSGLSVYLQTLNPNGGGDQTYELFVTSPTEYRFGPASN